MLHDKSVGQQQHVIILTLLLILALATVMMNRERGQVKFKQTKYVDKRETRRGGGRLRLQTLHKCREGEEERIA